MINIRANVFETNSSNVHNLVLLNDRDYALWKNGDVYLDIWSNKVYNKDEVDKKLEAEGVNLRYIADDKAYDELAYEYLDVLSINQYEDDYTAYYDTFDELYEFDGIIVHAVGYYGHD